MLMHLCTTHIMRVHSSCVAHIIIIRMRPCCVAQIMCMYSCCVAHIMRMHSCCVAHSMCMYSCCLAHIMCMYSCCLAHIICMYSYCSVSHITWKKRDLHHSLNEWYLIWQFGRMFFICFSRTHVYPWPTCHRYVYPFHKQQHYKW